MREHKLLLIGVGISAALLVTFLVLQATASWILDLPSQWLWVALVPVLACLVAGGYIGKFKASSDGIEFESAIPKEVKGIAEAPQGLKPLVEGQKAPWQNERAAEYIRTGGHFLVHVYEPSSESGQKYDVFVYLVSHQKNSNTPNQNRFPCNKTGGVLFWSLLGRANFYRH